VEPEIGIGGLFINPVFNEFSACPDSHRFPACRTTDAQSAQDPGQGSARQPEPSATNEPTGQPTSKGEGNAESEPRRADQVRPGELMLALRHHPGGQRQHRPRGLAHTQPTIRRLALRDVFLALDEGGWVENHDVKTLPLGMQRFQRIEGVVTDGFERYAVVRGIALSKVE